MPSFRRPDGSLFEYDEPRYQHNRFGRSPHYDAGYPPYAEFYDDYDKIEPAFYPYRRRYLPDGCAIWLLVVVVILACLVFIFLTLHPQGFQLIHFG